MNVTSPTNILEGSSDICIMGQSPNNAGVTIGEFTNPKTNNKVKAIKLNKDASIPNIWLPYIGLKTNTNYVLEFDYWADADDVKFDVDLFPDDLPQSFPIAKKTVQRYKWEFSSPSVNMTATMLRFFNDTVQINPANIYITNIKLYESSKANETSREYFYVRNAQNDIIGLVNGAGDQVVSYVYDTWGKQVSISGSLAGSIGELNPYRYKGYRYDTETGLYYLQSRYYNPEWGRFINADSEGGTVGELISHNVFAYCSNNPINRFDPDGQAWWVIGAVAGAVVGGIAGAAYSYYTTGSVDWKYVAGGAAAGALIGSGLGYAAEAAFATVTAVATTSSTAVTKYDPKFAAQQLVKGGKTTANALKSMVPKGSVNQFKPSPTISNGYKYLNKINGTKVEIKWHAPDLNAASKFGGMSNSGSGWTAQIKVGNRLLGQDLKFYKNPSNITHIPLFPGGE